MKEFLQKLIDHDYDGINFYVNEDDDFEVTAFKYHDSGEKIPGSTMGDWYDIIIINDNKEEPDPPERFEAILSSPPHYISRMLDDGFVGVVGRKTTTSDKVMDAIFASLLEDDNDDEQ